MCPDNVDKLLISKKTGRADKSTAIHTSTISSRTKS